MPSCCTGPLPKTGPEPKKHGVHFLIGRGGGGHIAAAKALQACLIARNVPWAKDIEIIDTGYLFEHIITGRSEPKQSGFDADELYNWLMKRGHYRLAALLCPLGAFVINMNSSRLIRGLEHYWRERQPRAVVSFVPVSGTVLRCGLLRACPNAPLLTVVTDMSSTSSHKWIDPFEAETSVNHTMVAGSDALVKQVEAAGYPREQTLVTSGMLVHPRFYAEAGTPQNVAANARKTRGVIFFGGQAPMRVEGIVRRALEQFPELHLVVMCGGNKKLLERMQQLDPARCTPEGFLPPEQIRDHFCHASFLIGKPGPGVVAEALLCGLPYIVEANGHMHQELSVLEYLQSTGCGVVVGSLEALPGDLLGQCEAAREAVAGRPKNRAVHEVADVLEAKLAAQGGEWQEAPSALEQRGG